MDRQEEADGLLKLLLKSQLQTADRAGGSPQHQLHEAEVASSAQLNVST